jgi:hypothetical protein
MSLGLLVCFSCEVELLFSSDSVECVTFNPTVALFPKEFHDMMLINDEDTVRYVCRLTFAWSHCYRKTTNWFVKEDPLAYGVDFLKWNYGLPFGRNNILPAIYSVNLFRNHQLTNFITVWINLLWYTLINWSTSSQFLSSSSLFIYVLYCWKYQHPCMPL